MTTKQLEELAERVVTAYLNDQTGPVMDYVRRGRLLETVSTEDLKASWVAALKAMAADITNGESFRYRDDAEAELTLRGVPAPFEEVPAEVEAISRAAAAVYEAMLRDPAKQEAAAYRRFADELASV